MGLHQYFPRRSAAVLGFGPSTRTYFLDESVGGTDAQQFSRREEYENGISHKTRVERS